MEDVNSSSMNNIKINIPSWVYVALAILVVFVILVIFLRIFYIPQQNEYLPPSSSEYGPMLGWGEPSIAVGAVPRGYEFPIQNNDGTLTITPATLNQEVLSNPEAYGIKVTDPYPCIDLDQMNAIMATHTCSEFPKNFDPSTAESRCITLDGEAVSYEEIEQYYTKCDQKGFIENVTLYCPGQVGGVAVNFNKTPSTGLYDTLYCVKKDGDNITADECDLADKNFQFRIILTTPRNWPGYATTYGSSGTSGYLASFVHRESGLCLDVLDPSNKNSQKLTLRDCGEVYNFGYTWQLFSPANLSCVLKKPTNFECENGATFQSYAYDPTAPNGIGTEIHGCPRVSCTDIKSWRKSTIADDPNNSVYSWSTLSPQQIVYIGYANGAEITTRLLTTIDITNFFYDIGAMALTFDGKDLITKPFARWESYTGRDPTLIIDNRIFNSQVASFLTYNLIYGSSFASPFFG